MTNVNLNMDRKNVSNPFTLGQAHHVPRNSQLDLSRTAHDDLGGLMKVEQNDANMMSAPLSFAGNSFSDQAHFNDGMNKMPTQHFPQNEYLKYRNPSQPSILKSRSTEESPLRLLTKRLVTSYNEINQKYYAEKRQHHKKQKLLPQTQRRTSLQHQNDLNATSSYSTNLGMMSKRNSFDTNQSTQSYHSSFGYSQGMQPTMANYSGYKYEDTYQSGYSVQQPVNNKPAYMNAFGSAHNTVSNMSHEGGNTYPINPQQPSMMNATADTLNMSAEDPESDYQVHRGELLNYKYMVKDKIGRGSFGQVVSAVDQVHHRRVAIKIIKNRKPFFLQARTEIGLLKELNIKDRHDEYNIVTLLDTFVHMNHQCLVFELLSFNLYDLLRKTNFQGVSLDLVKKFGKQLLVSLCYLKKLHVIHCDLKPENILLRDQKRSLVKIIDFGSSCKIDQKMYSYIQSRFYRAPEVLLGQGYSIEIDMWSLGCILVELHSGEPLFCGSNEYEQMLRIVCLKGIPDSHLLDYSTKANMFFTKTGGSWHFDLVKLKPHVTGNVNIQKFPRSLQQVVGLERLNSATVSTEDEMLKKAYQRRCHTSGHSIEDYREFLDLVSRMLEYDPVKRIDPMEALKHPFFSMKHAPNHNLPGNGSVPFGAVMNGAPKQEADQIFGSIKRTGSAPNLNLLGA